MGVMGFREKLALRQKSVNSLVCVGLDPLPEKLPKCVGRGSTNCLADWVAWWMQGIVDATAPFACMYKLQRASYEGLDEDALLRTTGERAMRNVVEYIHDRSPDIPVFIDCKRGDIDRTQQRYRRALFEFDGADGVNYSPYMGDSCLKGLVDPDHPEHALVNLCYTSNPSARQVQDALLANGFKLWEQMALWTLEWSEKNGVLENAGLVMAAAYENPKGSGQVYSKHLSRCRELVGDKFWFLIPGVGTQHGAVKETVEASFNGWGSIAINSSSDIIFASQGEDYAEAAAKKAEELRDKIRAAIPKS